MKKITIPLSGISRNTDDTISTDGDCIELINARVKNGSISPVGRPILEKASSLGRVPIFIHKSSNYEHFLSYNKQEEKLYFEFSKENNQYINVNTFICNAPGLVCVENTGNMISIITNTNILYALFINGKYKSLGSKPKLPLLRFSIGGVRSSNEKLPGTYDIHFDASGGNNVKNRFEIFHTACEGAMLKASDDILENGYMYKYSFIRYALRLFDGSIILHSPVYVIKGDGVEVLYDGRSSGDGWIVDYSNATVSVTVKGYRINFDVIEDYGISNWAEVIQSIDIYASEANQYRQTSPSVPSSSTRSVSWSLVDNISSMFENTSNFHLIDKIDISQIKKGYSPEGESIKRPNRPDLIIKGMKIAPSILKNLVLQERMEIDNFSHNDVTGKCSYVYNSRLHMGNIISKLFSGYPYTYLANGWDSESEGFYSAEITVKLNSESGESVLAIYELFPLSNGLSPVLIYPDSRAYQMTIKIYSANRTRSKTFNLKKHPYLNCSYYQDPNLDPIHLENSSPDGFYPTKEVNNIEYSPNKIKVSALNNPLAFPVEQTYTVSNGDVVALATATTALSTGQFGQYPLYVFCSDGIYALSVGSGAITYSTSAPVSRDICINPQGIASIDNAIAFASSAGLMLLSGSTVQKLSYKIEGYLPSSIDSSLVINKILDIPKLQASTAEFRDYIENSSIGYIYEEKEIIVANKNYPYSYVYNLQSEEWHKISISISSFLNSYPQSLAIVTENSGCGVYNLYNPHRTINNIAIITRPIKFGSLTHKRILQSALRGIIKPSLSDVYLRGEAVQFREKNVEIFSEAGFYILGSNDAEHFSLISGTEKLNDIRDIITKMNKTKAYKYFMFCLVGGVRTDVAINYIEVMADETFDNRLR